MARNQGEDKAYALIAPCGAIHTLKRLRFKTDDFGRPWPYKWLAYRNGERWQFFKSKKEWAEAVESDHGSTGDPKYIPFEELSLQQKIAVLTETTAKIEGEKLLEQIKKASSKQ